MDQEKGLKFHSSVFQPPVCHSCQIYTRAFQTGSSSSRPGLTHGHLEPGLENKQPSMHENFLPVNKQPPKIDWLSDHSHKNGLNFFFQSLIIAPAQSWWQWISATVVRTFIPMAGPLGKLSSFTASLSISGNPYLIVILQEMFGDWRWNKPCGDISRLTDSSTSRNSSFLLYLIPSLLQPICPVTWLVIWACSSRV